MAKIPKAIRFAVFKTKWGYFGLAGTEYGLLRSCLPGLELEKVKFQLLKNLHTVRYDRLLFKPLQEQIIAYFKGACVNFGSDCPVRLDGLSGFAISVLSACRSVRFGHTISYGRLAQRLGNRAAARAVGGALARNPLPLIIPCHRVIRSDGKSGGFSASGGVKLKKKLLELERQVSAKHGSRYDIYANPGNGLVADL